MKTHASQVVPAVLALLALASCASPASGQCPGGVCFRRPAVQQQPVQYAPATYPPVVAWPAPVVVGQPAFHYQPAVPVAPLAVTYRPAPAVVSAPLPAVTYYPGYPELVRVGGELYYRPSQAEGAPLLRYYPQR